MPHQLSEKLVYRPAKYSLNESEAYRSLNELVEDDDGLLGCDRHAPSYQAE
jgi:hypothetical protein